ncbi:hypothetical protein NN811_001728 [Listeria monocytogenes]|nr:hypothetical protein [Listeria monocytogenes]
MLLIFAVVTSARETSSAGGLFFKVARFVGSFSKQLFASGCLENELAY